MKDPETRALLAWTAWMIALSGISGASYRFWPRQDTPSIEVSAVRDSLDGGEPVVVKFVRKGRTHDRIAVRYRIELDQGPGTVADVVAQEQAGEVAIEPTSSEATLPLTRKPEEQPRAGQSVREDRRRLVVRVVEGDGYVVESGKASAEFSVTTRNLGSLPEAPEIRLASTSKVFDDENPIITVDFRLDRECPYRIEVPFVIEGDALPEDYEVNPRGSRAVAFEPGSRLASIKLSRPKGGVDRGRGDRDVLVRVQPTTDAVRIVGGQVRLTIPDAIPELTWGLSTDKNSSPLVDDSQVWITVNLNKPIAEKVEVRYRIVADDDLNIDFPANYKRREGEGVVTLPTRGIGKEGPSDQFKLIVKRDDRVGGPSKMIRVECLEVTPKSLAPKGVPLSPLLLPVADDKQLDTGRGLVLVVATKKLRSDGGEILNDLKELRKQEGKDLIGGTFYLLSAGKSRSIRRFNPDREFPEEAECFEDSTPADVILRAAYDGVREQFGGRIKAQDRTTFLVWRDPADMDRGEASANNPETPPTAGRGWHLVFVGEGADDKPAPGGEAGLANLLLRRFRRDGRLMRFHPEGMPTRRNAVRGDIVNLLK